MSSEPDTASAERNTAGLQPRAPLSMQRKLAQIVISLVFDLGDNTASGVNALLLNTSGAFNTASGQGALHNNASSNKNIAVGYQAGENLTTGSNNIDIGSPGVAAESGVIRIGTITGTTSTQSATYIARIYNNTSVTSGLEVVINSSGELGVVSSSKRFKTGIAPMGSNTAKLEQLRPVTFHCRTDPSHSAKTIPRNRGIRALRSTQIDTLR